MRLGGAILGVVAAITFCLPADASSIDKDLIRRVVRRHIGAVGRCYESVVGEGDVPPGKLVVKFVIGLDGRVSSAERHPDSTLDAPEIEACILKEVRSWRFPPPHAEPVTVTYPFNIDWAR